MRCNEHVSVIQFFFSIQFSFDQIVFNNIIKRVYQIELRYFHVVLNMHVCRRLHKINVFARFYKTGLNQLKTDTVSVSVSNYSDDSAFQQQQQENPKKNLTNQLNKLRTYDHIANYAISFIFFSDD